MSGHVRIFSDLMCCSDCLFLLFRVALRCIIHFLPVNILYYYVVMKLFIHLREYYFEFLCVFTTTDTIAVISA